jgi:hypothetical protein
MSRRDGSAYLISDAALITTTPAVRSPQALSSSCNSSSRSQAPQPRAGPGSARPRYQADTRNRRRAAGCPKWTTKELTSRHVDPVGHRKRRLVGLQLAVIIGALVHHDDEAWVAQALGEDLRKALDLVLTGCKYMAKCRRDHLSLVRQLAAG